MSPESVYGFATNLHLLPEIVPDLKEFTVKGDDLAELKVKAGVSFIKGSFNVNLQVTEKVPYSLVKAKGRGSGAGSSMNFTVSFALASDGKGSDINWEVDMTIGGTAATLGSRMVNDAARKYVDRVIEAFQAALVKHNEN